MQTTSGFVASTASKSVVMRTSQAVAEQLADGLALLGGVDVTITPDELDVPLRQPARSRMYASGGRD
jgi:hypothetical protein